jgi:hypothetical protein
MSMTDLKKAAQQALEALESLYLTLPPESVLAKSLNLRITTLKAALEQPEQCSCGDRLKDQCPGEWELGCDLGNNPAFARRVALEQPEQEPEWLTGCPSCGMDGGCDCDEGTYNPPRRAWRGLTDTEIGMLYVKWDATPGVSMADFARAIEKALKEKNHE